MEYISKYKTWYELYFQHRNIFIDTVAIIFAVVFLGAMSNIYVPLWPVPITMQTFGLFLIAFFFGSRKGALTILLYLTAGLLGFGVFAQHKSGIIAITGPTGGFLLGFLVCVFTIGFMIEQGYGKTKKSVLLCMMTGNLIIYLFGLIGLGIFFKEFNILKLLTMGVFPFLIGDALKILAAVGIFPLLWKKKA